LRSIRIFSLFCLVYIFIAGVNAGCSDGAHIPSADGGSEQLLQEVDAAEESGTPELSSVDTPAKEASPVVERPSFPDKKTQIPERTAPDNNPREAAPDRSVSPPDKKPPASGPNAYSWDGSWKPTQFPIKGLLDETHKHLPPGKWGWDNSCNCPGDKGLAIYKNEFFNKDLDFRKLLDASGRHFGWRLISRSGKSIQLNHRGDHYDGTVGVDIFDLTLQGQLNGTGPSSKSNGINLGDGPDMLRYAKGWSVDLRTGSDTRGSRQDNDLVILGSEANLPMNQYDIKGTTIHTGPGADLVFARNFGPAAIDLGNGAAGRTDTVDKTDGNDIVVLQGNMRDFRVYGGYGSDTFIWYVDEVKENRWLGPNFFGGGGWGKALWDDNGKDRLILAIPPKTEVVSSRSKHDNNPGSLLIFVYSNYKSKVDAPTAKDAYARYYGTAPVGPKGEHTLTVSYRSQDKKVFTHDFYITSVEELQLGTGSDARVYRLDSKTGKATLDPTLKPFTNIPKRSTYNKLFDTFAKKK